MTQKSKGKGSKKYGRNKVKCDVYRKSNTEFKNKIRRVLKHNGLEAADLYRRLRK